jgi:hypothetical protein
MHPSYDKKPTKGGKTTRKVIDAFIADPDGMHQVAQALWKNGDLARPEPGSFDEQETEPGVARLLNTPAR